MKAILFGYDTEDYGRKVSSEPEKKKCRDNCVESVKKLISLHEEFDTNATFFMLGKLVEVEDRFVDIFSETMFDIQQHTYSHSLIKEMSDVDRSVISSSELDSEIKLTNRLILEKYGVKCNGIRLPYCYPEGIKDYQAVIDIFKKHNFKFMSTDLAGTWHKITTFSDHPKQPYLVDDILEIPINGLLDVVFNDSKTKIAVDFFIEELKYASEHDLIYVPCFHPWCINKLDLNLSVIRGLLEFATENNIKVLSYSDYYNKLG